MPTHDENATKADIDRAGNIYVPGLYGKMADGDFLGAVGLVKEKIDNNDLEKNARESQMKTHSEESKASEDPENKRKLREQFDTDRQVCAELRVQNRSLKEQENALKLMAAQEMLEEMKEMNQKDIYSQ